MFIVPVSPPGEMTTAIVRMAICACPYDVLTYLNTIEITVKIPPGVINYTACTSISGLHFLLPVFC